jgi:hypothetical protein
LVNNRGGTYVPTELIFARTCVRGFNVKLKLSPHLVSQQSKQKMTTGKPMFPSKFILAEKRPHVTYPMSSGIDAGELQKTSPHDAIQGVTAI